MAAKEWYWLAIPRLALRRFNGYKYREQKEPDREYQMNSGFVWISGAWVPPSTADKSQVLKLSSKWKENVVAKERIFLSPYFSPKHCLLRHKTHSWIFQSLSRRYYFQKDTSWEFKAWGALLEQRWNSCLLAGIKSGMENSQKESKDGLESGQKEIKGTLAAWRYTPEVHESRLQGRPLGLRKYLLHV